VISIPDRERRQHERFPQVFDVHGRCLLSVQSASNETEAKEFDGRIQNLSNGGACILSASPLLLDAFVCCSLPVADDQVSVPLLMQVRWTLRRGRKNPNYITGFKFVF
jgi:hypothetical protein